MALKFCKKGTCQIVPLQAMVLCFLFLLVNPSVFGETLVRIGCDRDYPPFSVLGENKVTGFDADLIRLLAPMADIDPEFVPSSWSSALHLLEMGQVEIVTAVIYTDTRSETFDFSIPYVTDYYNFFSREELEISVPEDTEGKLLALLKDDASLERFVVPEGLDKHLILTETYTEAILLVQQGVADYTIAPYSLGTQIINELDASTVHASGRNLFPVSYRLAVKKGNHALLFRLNEGISTLSQSGEIHNLRKKWFPRPVYTTPANNPLRQLFAKVFLHILGVLVLVGCSFLTGRGLSLRLSRKIREERDCLRAVIDVAPIGLRWHSLPTGVFMENRYWRETYARMKHFRTDETDDVEVHHFTGVNGEENWVRFHKKTFVSEATELPVTLYIMEDITAVRILEEAVDEFARERTHETARLLVENIADPETGLFSADFLQARIQELASEYETTGRAFSVLCFLVSPENCGQDWNRTAAPLVREAIRRIDYPGTTVSGRLIILLPGTDEKTGHHIAKEIITSFETAGFDYPLNEYQVLSYPKTDINLLLQRIQS